MRAQRPSDQPAPHDGSLPIENAQLYYRAIGQGQPILILHGGPDFYHDYFLPDLDRLADAFRLIYYDQRGRGRSSGTPEEVSLQSELQDVERVREFFQLESLPVLGHSWGGLLAMEYAVRHPNRVSHLILMNTAPASSEEYQSFRQELLKNTPEDSKKMQAIKETAAFQQGNPAAVMEFYRIHYQRTLKQPEHLERLMQGLSVHFTSEKILQGWAIEDRLMQETYEASGYTVLPQLAQLRIPTLLIHGDYDFIPISHIEHIAQAIPGARLVVLPNCGHFSYIEHPDKVRQEISAFLQGTSNRV